MTDRRRQPGDQVVVRSVWGAKIQIAMPMTVIADTERITALYLAAGTPIKNKSTYRSDHLPIGDWEMVDDIWRDDLIRIKSADDAHAYYAMWKGGRFHRWYVNLESAYQRTSIGFDFTDHVLDLVVEPDLAGWRWKDEDELARAVGLGLVTQTQADAFYAEGERAIARLEAKRSPFADGWETWRPDPAWPIPALPCDWDLIE
ncbi:MAG: DUF402 domain-containing protein [Chloroflexi bacterium]|nr:DUF402 domain-containing protein [Chloroflexota bacterium]